MNQSQDTNIPLIDQDKPLSSSNNQNTVQTQKNPTLQNVIQPGTQQYQNPGYNPQNPMMTNPNPYNNPQYMMPNQFPPSNQYRAPNQPYLLPQGQVLQQNIYTGPNYMHPGQNIPQNQQPYSQGQFPTQGQGQNSGSPDKRFVPFNQAYSESVRNSLIDPNKPYQPSQNLDARSKFHEGNLEGNRNEFYENVQICCGGMKGFLGAFLCPCLCSNPYRIIPQGFEGIILRFGKFKTLLSSGIFYVNVDVDTLRLIDKREKTVDLMNQLVVSKDNMTLKINVVMFYRVFNSYKSLFRAGDVTLLVKDLAQTTMRAVVGQLTMQEFLERKDTFDLMILESMAKVSVNWGVNIIRVLVQDMQLPNEYRNTMSSAAIQKKVGEAKMITAQADVESARLMKQTADLLNTEAALQIRYLETIEQISNSSNPKLVLFPTDYNDVGCARDDDEDVEETDKLIN